jgi:sec-independent protein translocase protein TatA
MDNALKARKYTRKNFIMGLGAIEWVVIVLIILLLFGAKKIPELARGLGQGINEFRKASTEIRKEIEKGADDVKETPRKKEDVTLQ